MTSLRVLACLTTWLFATAGQTLDTDPEVPLSDELSSAQETLLDIAVTLLADWITDSRDTALAEGTDAIPAAIRAALNGYVPAEVLDAVRWRIGGGGTLSLQRGMFKLGDSPAITLDNVIVFETQAHVEDPKLWAHELMHVMQFKRWGIAGFASRYVEDHEAIEAEAAEFRWEWMKHTNRVPDGTTPPVDPD